MTPIRGLLLSMRSAETQGTPSYVSSLSHTGSSILYWNEKEDQCRWKYF